MPRLACPSRGELAAFNLGNLSEARLEAIVDHLERCTRCEAALDSLEREADPVVAALKGLSGAGSFPVAPASTVVAPPAQIDGYEILGELGRGGMGVVYKAWHAKLHRVVALKMLLGGDFARDDYRVRFRAEAEAFARLQHPNIIQIFDIGEWYAPAASAPVPYFTLECVEGGSLGARMAGNPLPPQRAASWLSTLARAVHHAHGQGIVHRDLKPSNVLLTADGQIKLGDFGVAKQLSGSDLKTLGGLLVGTPEYMAPEQADGQGGDAGPSADVYALGAILYAMLTGRPPFQSASVLDTLEQVRSQEPVSPRRLQPAIPRDLETICLKCLNKDPKRRYAGADELAEDLDRFSDGLTIRARPAGPAETAWKWARRRPSVALLSAATVLVTVLSFVLVFWQWQAEVAANERAQRARRDAVREQAELALSQGMTLCDRGEVGHGLLWLSRSLELSKEAGTANLDRAIRINLADWGAQVSRPRLSSRLPAPILDLAFGRDGKTLAAVGKSRNIGLWDLGSKEEEVSTLVLGDLGESQWVERVALNPRDPGVMVTVDAEGHANFWDVADRQLDGPPLLHPPSHGIWGLAFHPDGRRLVTSCDDGMARWWDVATRTQIGEPLRHSDRVGYYSLALSPDGRRLVTGGRDHRAVLWDVASGEPIGQPLMHTSPVHMLAFCGDGRRVITGTRDGKLHVWDPDTSRVVELPPQGSSVSALAVSPDGRTFATGTANGVVRLWDATRLGQVGQTSKLVTAVTGLAFHPDGRTLAIGQDDGVIRLWDVPEPKAIGTLKSLNVPVKNVAFDREGTRLLVGGSKGAQWWGLSDDLARGPRMHSDRYEPSGMAFSEAKQRPFEIVDLVEAIVVSPDGRTLATARWSGDEAHVRGRLEIWDAGTGERLRVSSEQPSPLLGVAYSPDSRRVVTWSGSARSALLWDVADLRHPRPILKNLDTAIQQAVFSHDGKTILVAGREVTARLWDVASDREVVPATRPQHGYPVTAVAFNPSGTMMATGCLDGSVRLWSYPDVSLAHDVRGNAGEVVAATFSPDSRILLTASHDGTARFWDVASGKQLGPALRHTDAVLAIAYHPNGRSVATGTKDGMTQRWHVPLAPEPGDTNQIRQKVEMLSGLGLDSQGTVHTLYANTLK